MSDATKSLPEMDNYAGEVYRVAAELAGLIVWTADENGQFQSISPEFSQITGLSPGTQSRAIHPDDVQRVMKAWQRSIAAGKNYHAEFRMRVNDGSYRYFRARSGPRRDAVGRIIGWYGFTEDIHHPRSSEIDLARMEERYRLASLATNDALYDLDLIDRQISWRAEDSAFFGYAPQEAPTPLSWWEERIHPDDREWVVRGFNRTMASDRTRWAVDYRFLKADGRYAYLHDQGVIVRDSAGRALRAVGAMSDVTQQRRAEAEVKRIQAEVIHLSRLTAMETMASTLAHELNQPLAAASNYFSAARRLAGKSNVPLHPDLLDAIDSAAASTMRAGEIVRRLREMVASKKTSATAENLAKLIEEAGILAFVDADVKGVTYRIELAQEAQWVWADRIQIQQVMINLIRNAIDAMEKGPRREVLISAEPGSGGMVQISVSDTGSGIAQSKIDSLFSQFVTTKEAGLGVGLPICRTIVEAHGGRIWAISAEGQGATFSFTLPMSQPRGKGSLRP